MNRFAALVITFLAAAFPLAAQNNPYGIEDSCYHLYLETDALIGRDGFEQANARLLEQSLAKNDTQAQTLYYVERFKDLTRRFRAVAQSTNAQDAQVIQYMEDLQEVALSFGYKQFYYYAFELAHDALVFLVACRAKLTHVAQYHHLVCVLHKREVRQRRRHARGVGIVGIHDETVASHLLQLAASVRRIVGSKRLVNLFGANAEGEADGDSGTKVGDVIGSDEMRADRVPRLIDVCPPLELDEWPRAAYPSFDVRQGIVLERKATTASHLKEVGVEGIQEHFSSASMDVVVEFALRLLHALEASKALKMSASDVGDESEVSLSYAAESCYLAGMVGTRLDDGHFVLRLDTQEGERHADVVVQVALGAEHALPLREDGRGQFLGGRLTVGTRNLQHRSAPSPAMVGGQLLQSLQHIGNKDEPFVQGRHAGIIDHSEGTARLEGLGGELVAVERSTLQGKEDAALGRVAAVGRHLRMLAEDGI